MTFKIFDDNARDQIADHIIGSPPSGHPRFGGVSGTDVHTSATLDPPCYGVTCPRPPDYGTCVGSGCAETQDGRFAYIDCDKGIHADHSGKCPPGYIRQVDQKGLVYCCPKKTDGGVKTTPPTDSSNACDEGTRLVLAMKRGQGGEAGYAAFRKKCEDMKGTMSWDKSKHPHKLVCCAENDYGDGTKPPTKTPQTPVATYPVKPVLHPPPVAGSLIVLRTATAIGGKQMGTAMKVLLTPAAGVVFSDAACDYTTPRQWGILGANASDSFNKNLCEEGKTSDSSYATRFLKLYNPGNSTIPKDTDVVAGLQASFLGSETSIWIAVVVPCAT